MKLVFGAKLYEEQESRTQSCATRREGNKIWRRHSCHTLALQSATFLRLSASTAAGGVGGGVGVGVGGGSLS